MNHADSTIIKAQKGDEAACSKLVELWYKRIHNYALKYLGNHDQASEVTQKTFITMYHKINMLEDSSRFKPWLYKIASNYCHEEYRQKTRERKYFYKSDQEEEEEIMIIRLGVEPDVEQKLNQQDMGEIIKQILQHLPLDQREVIIMKEYEGMKFREIAEVLNVSENTVKSRLYYGLSTMKKILDKRNITKEKLYYEN